MTRQEAAEILGCVVGASAATVRQAFSETVKDHHPDTEEGRARVEMVGPGNYHSRRTLADIKKARDILLNLAPTDCPECRGTGWVSGQGFRQTRCRKGC